MIDDLLSVPPPPPLPAPQENPVLPESPYPLGITSQGIQSRVGGPSLIAPPKPRRITTVHDLARIGPSGQALDALYDPHAQHFTSDISGEGPAPLPTTPSFVQIAHEKYQPTRPVASTTGVRGTIPNSVIEQTPGFIARNQQIEQGTAAREVGQQEAQERDRQARQKSEAGMSPWEARAQEFMAGVRQATPFGKQIDASLGYGSPADQEATRLQAATPAGFVGSTANQLLQFGLAGEATAPLGLGKAAAGALTFGGVTGIQSGGEVLSGIQQINDQVKAGKLSKEQAAQAQSSLITNALASTAGGAILGAALPGMAGVGGKLFGRAAANVTGDMLGGTTQAGIAAGRAVGTAGATVASTLAQSAISGETPDLTSTEALINTGGMMLGEGVGAFSHESPKFSPQEFAASVAPHADVVANESGLPAHFVAAVMAHDPDFKVNDPASVLKLSDELQKPEYDNVREAIANGSSMGTAARELKKSGWTDDKKFAQKVGKTAVELQPHIEQAIGEYHATETGQEEHRPEHTGVEQGAAPSEDGTGIRQDESAPDRRSDSNEQSGQVEEPQAEVIPPSEAEAPISEPTENQDAVQSEISGGPDGTGAADELRGVHEGVQVESGRDGGGEDRQRQAEELGARGGDFESNLGDESLREEGADTFEEPAQQSGAGSTPQPVEDRFLVPPKYEAGQDVKILDPNEFLTDASILDHRRINGVDEYRLGVNGEDSFNGRWFKESDLEAPKQQESVSSRKNPRAQAWDDILSAKPGSAYDYAVRAIATGTKFDRADANRHIGDVRGKKFITSKDGELFDQWIQSGMYDLYGDYNANDSRVGQWHDELESAVQKFKSASEARDYLIDEYLKHNIGATEGKPHFDNSEKLLHVTTRAEAVNAIKEVAPHIPAERVEYVMSHVVDPMAKAAGLSTDEFVKNHVQYITNHDVGVAGRDVLKQVSMDPRTRALFEDIRKQFPGLPILRARKIAERFASQDRMSGNARHENRVLAIVAADFRHDRSITHYDDLLSKGVPKEEARRVVQPDIERALNQARVAFRQDYKGAVSLMQTGEKILHLMGTSDVSTLIHEFGHIGRQAGVLKGDDLRTVEKWAGVRKGNWTRSAEEKFARGLERYILEGNVPGNRSDLRDAFGKLKDWMRDVYVQIFKENGVEKEGVKNAEIRDIKVSPEVKAVFDRMLGGDGSSAKTEFAKPEAPKLSPFNIADIARGAIDDIAAHESGPLFQQEGAPDWFVQRMVEKHGEAVRPHVDEIWQEANRLKDEPKMTALKNAVVDQDRKTREMDPRQEIFQRTFEKVADDAKQILADRPSYGSELVSELAKKPRALNDTEDAVLTHEQLMRQQEHDRALAAVDDAEVNGSSYDMQIARAWERSAFNKLKEVYDVGQAVGTENARGLNARKMMLAEDYTLGRLEARKESALGRGLTDVDRKELKSQWEELEKARKSLDEERARFEEQRKKATAEQAHKNVVREKPTAKQRFSKQAESGVAKAAALLKKANPDKALFQMEDSIPALLAKRAAEHLINGVPESDIGTRLARELRENGFAMSDEGIKEYMEPTLKLAREIADLRTPQDILSGAKGLDHKLVYELTRAHVNAGSRGFDETMNAVHQDVQTLFPDASLTDVYDALSQYGERRYPSPDEDRKLVREYTGAALLKSKIDRATRNERVEKTGLQRDKATPEQLKLHKELRDALKSEGYPEVGPEETLQSAAERYLNYVNKRTADARARYAAGDYMPQPRSKPPQNGKIIEAQKNYNKAKNAIDDAIEKHYLDNRSAAEVGLDWWQGFNRGVAKLSGISTLGKLAAYGLGRIPLNMAEEGVGEALSHIPIYRELSKAAPREGGGLNAGAIAKSITSLWKDAILSDGQTVQAGIKQSIGVFKGGSEVNLAYGKHQGPGATPEAMQFFAHLHEALKTPVKVKEFVYSYEKRLAHAIENGQDVHDPVVQMAIARDAYLDGNREILMADNRFANSIRQFAHRLEAPNKDGHVPLGGKIGAAAVRTLVTFTRVPSNYVSESFGSLFGLLLGNVRLGSAILKGNARALATGQLKFGEAVASGLDKLSNEQRDLILRNIKRGAIGAAFFSYGFFDDEDWGGYNWRDTSKKHPAVGGLRVFGMELPKWATHNPYFEVAQMGATFRRAIKSHTDGVIEPMAEALLGPVEHAPVANQALEFSKLFDPRQRAKFIGRFVEQNTVPVMVQEIARATDRRFEGIVPVGKERKRATKTILDQEKEGIPGLRETLPLK